MSSEIKDVKKIETKLEELEIKILRKSYRNENTSRTRNRVKNKKKKKTEKEYKIKEYKILIDITISDAEDLKIEVINKLNEMKKVRTKIDELENEIALACTEYE